MARQALLRVVVEAFVIGCAVALVVVGCAGVRSGASQEEQERTEATKKEQARSPEATASEEARCEGTRTIKVTPAPRSDVWDMGKKVDFTTYDLRGCPKGGLLSGTDKPDKLAGRDVDDEIRGLGAEDYLIGGLGNDVIYGGPGSDRLADWPLASMGDYGWERMERILREASAKAGGDDVLYGGDGNDELVSDKGEDVFYGGDGSDILHAASYRGDLGADKLYCGAGEDVYTANKNDYVDSSCERELPP